jgi:CTP:molybdopterin cytidylyltransferase MocA
MQQATGLATLGLVPLAGQPMVAHVVRALSAAKSVSDVWVVGPEALRSAVGTAHLVPEAGEMAANIEAGVRASAAASLMLLCTADVPFLTPQAVDDFVERCVASGADLCYAIVRREDALEAYPGMHRTFVRTGDGAFTGGNLVVMRVPYLTNILALIETVRAARKSPLKLAKVFGPAILLGFLLGCVKVKRIEQRAARLVGGTLRAIVTPYPEIAADVDKPEDLRAAENLLAQRASGA